MSEATDIEKSFMGRLEIYNADGDKRFVILNRGDFQSVYLEAKHIDGNWGAVILSARKNDPSGMLRPVEISVNALIETENRDSTAHCAYDQNGNLINPVSYSHWGLGAANRELMIKTGHFTHSELPTTIDIEETIRLFFVQAKEKNFNKPILIPKDSRDLPMVQKKRRLTFRKPL